jgi:hypothetical protein
VPNTDFKQRLLDAGDTVDAFRGKIGRIIPDQFVTTGIFAAAQLTGANSGFFVFIAPAPMLFVDGDIIWGTAGTNTLRVKKVAAATVGAPGAAVAAGHVDISANVDLTTAALTSVPIVAVTAGSVNRLAEGDKVAIASSAGTASLAGAFAVLRFVYV